MQALVDHDEVAAGLEKTFPLVREAADLEDDLGHGLVGVPGLTLPDEAGVLGDAGGAPSAGSSCAPLHQALELSKRVITRAVRALVLPQLARALRRPVEQGGRACGLPGLE